MIFRAAVMLGGQEREDRGDVSDEDLCSSGGSTVSVNCLLIPCIGHAFTVARHCACEVCLCPHGPFCPFAHMYTALSHIGLRKAQGEDRRGVSTVARRRAHI